MINEDYRFELGLNDEQESVLQRLGYLPSDNTSSKKKNKSYSHVVFANDDDKREWDLSYKLYISLMKKYSIRQRFKWYQWFKW